MTPEAVAALVISIVSAAVALGGLTVGIIGLVQSSRAQRVAKAAVAAAEGANHLSTEANGIAREANQISRTASQQTHERHDVRWDAKFVDDGVLVVLNLGRDTAYKVLIRAIFDGQPPREAEAVEVPQHDEVRVDLPSVRAQLQKDRREDATPTPGILIAASSMRMFRIEVEATWESESGRAYRDDSIGGTWNSLEP